MNSLKRVMFAVAFSAALLLADGPGRIESRQIGRDFALTADPNTGAWKNVTGVFADHGPKGDPVPDHKTEIRSRWTRNNLYILFICPFQDLHLKASPSTSTETNKLWDYDVAEIFIGTDFDHIRHYTEFEVSPQGEWVDLDIDRDHPKPEGGWLWNSGFKVKARIDQAQKVWYGEMQIPMKSIDTRPARRGNEMRVNLYRIEGAEPHRIYIAWQPTNSSTYHVPEAFGRLVLAK
jgi:hypothetical protein